MDWTLEANFAPIATCTIAATESPPGSGAVSGAGTQAVGATVTLTATAYGGFRFVDWTEGGAPVSTTASYTFVAGGDRTLVANFVARPGGLQRPGNANGDASVDISDPVTLLGFLFMGAPARLPCGDGGAADPANVTLLDWQPDGKIDISDGVAMLSFLFLGGSPHALGPQVDPSGCLAIAGCPDACP